MLKLFNTVWKKIILLGLGVLLVLFLVIHLISTTHPMIYGVTFNYEYAQFLGLDPRKVYEAVLDDWKFKHIRISAQWNMIEKEMGKYGVEELDWMMNEAQKRNAHIVLALGQKTPRWPECHDPQWSKGLPNEEYRNKLNKFIEFIVKRYKNHPALEIWQVENEPLLKFGNCRMFSEELLKEELKLVKQLDPLHPTLTTDSGELSLWRKTAHAADLFGTTMYRVIWNKYLGYLYYDWFPAAFYRWRLQLNHKDFNTAYVMELQAEPWIPNGSVNSTSLDEQYKSMDIKRLKKNVAFAAKTGMPRAYLWGVEWWYWLEKQGKKEISDYIKTLEK